MRRPADAAPRLAVVVVGTLVAATLVGCGAIDRARGCTGAGDSLVSELSAVGRSGLDGPTEVAIDHVEVGKTVVVDLPDDLRKFGADRLLASRVSVYDKDPVSASIPGLQGNALVAVSSSGELVAPIGKVTPITFDVPTPDDSAWEKWATEVADSSQADTARGCVDPDA